MNKFKIKNKKQSQNLKKKNHQDNQNKLSISSIIFPLFK